MERVNISRGYVDWVKTSRGWALQNVDFCAEDVPNQLLIKIGVPDGNREVSHGRCVKVQGTRGQRRMSVYLSEFIDVMDLADATRDIRRQAYLVDILRLMLTRFLHKLSGSSHRQLFKILDQLVHTVLKTEVGVRRLQRLLHETHKHLVEDTSRIDTRIGCRSLWNRHTQNVSNLLTQMGGFVYTEREEDGKPQLMDLPKECLFEIMYKLTDHRDLINLGLACWDLYHVTREESIWQKLLGFHFSPKQVATFTECIEDSDGDTLLQLYRHCYRKFGFRKLYTADQLVICSACKTLHWLKLGHYCWSDDKDRVNAVMEPISPGELCQILG